MLQNQNQLIGNLVLWPLIKAKSSTKWLDILIVGSAKRII